MAWWNKLFGDPQERKVKKYQPRVAEMNALEAEVAALSDDQLRAKTAVFQKRVADQLQGVDLDALEIRERRRRIDVALDGVISEAFAVVREAAKRVIGLRHYDVQLIGGLVLHEGQIAEMKTGEGKTLVATLPAYLNALTGRGVHIVTVNDYLARRDSEWMGQVHRFLGLSVGLIQQSMTPSERAQNYAADITYGTNSELGFDYLRDNMATNAGELVQRSFNYCIIDEVDSILVDEARTPLIISGMVAKPAEKYMRANEVATALERNTHYEVDEKQRNVTLTDEGFIAAEQMLSTEDLFSPRDPWAHFVFNAVKAKELFNKDVQYIVRNDEVVIVDEFTGRVMPGRRWSEGLHQAVEAKEMVTIQNETQTMASITYQNFFLLYPKLAGMTGTALTEEAEFGKIYSLEVTAIPTNRKVVRTDMSDQVYKTENGKWQSVAAEIAEMNKNGRPVLVGTTSVEKSEVLSALLKEKGIAHNLLNAKPENVERESEIVAQAGRKGGVTIATNMAGRGTDILLGGNPEYMARLKLKEVLFPALVIDDEDAFSPMMRLLNNGNSRGTGFAATSKKKALPKAEIFPCELSESTKQQLKAAVDYAVAMLGADSQPALQVEELIAVASEKGPTDDPVIQHLREIYRAIYKEYQVVTDREHDEVVKLGGLHVIGTERHEARRVDNQLRGRSGRQGDPGSTRFFLSLGDNLLRIFGGERVAGLMEAFKVEEDMPIESGLLTKSLENAQRKVETFYYDQRKQVFEYDEVMNNQRKAIYAERRRALEGQDLSAVVREYIDQTVDEIVRAHVNAERPPEEWELPALIQDLQQLIPLLENQLDAVKLGEFSAVELEEDLKSQALLAYETREEYINAIQPDLMREAERYFILNQIDTLWREHLQQMDSLREMIGLRGYGQKDPLIEYKNEGYELFLQMLVEVRRNVVFALYHFQPQYNPPIDPDYVDSEYV
ncbi:preprotein translocase subunit SecA [Gloeobacter violaceus]|uniref:Protein translocase subunit SecA n=1 Tax=Gloeobacter violaceus (strain ATCC 29082 / PCC 7421) TaxID=251221 RepID=SECA_GLOVI|nr:preprotein translocase subunit SecA [Gloeobacter violaceus]Q7NJJ6.1 RecName: Full=Protein translocase subunit SecA [Gloeobacter violaceus PCC 7421]BAC89777.1 preprotein translocase subunit [Gloeobacter violaceus PCC 7421]